MIEAKRLLSISRFYRGAGHRGRRRRLGTAADTAAADRQPTTAARQPPTVNRGRHREPPADTAAAGREPQPPTAGGAAQLAWNARR